MLWERTKGSVAVPEAFGDDFLPFLAACAQSGNGGVVNVP